MSRERESLVLLTAVALLVVLVVSAGCGGSKPTVYKIGVVISTSNQSAPLGQAQQRSLTLLEEQVNAAGGINGSKLQFIIQDDESDPAKANTAVSSLITSEKVLAVIGASTSGSTLAMADTIERNQVPLISCAAGEKITTPVKKYIFSVAPNDGLVSQRILMYVRDTLKMSKIAVLNDANAYGTGGLAALQQRAPAFKIQIVAAESYGSADTDMTSQLTKIQQANPQALVVWGTNPGPASIAKNMQTLGMTLPYIGSSGIANKSFITLAGPAANGVQFAASKLLIPSSITAGSAWAKSVNEFSAAYQKKYNMPIDPFAAHGWDAGNMIVNAIKSGAKTSANIRSQLEGLKSYPGVDGVFTYSPTNHAGLKVEALFVVKIVNGQWVEAAK